MADDAADRVGDGRTWSEFCRALERAGDTILRAGSPDDAFDRAEGFRYLSRLTRLALEKYVEHADPATPRFYRLSHETGKIGCDNPDSFYQNATLSGEHEYRIRGRRGTVSYLSLATYYGDYGKSGRSGCSGAIEGDELEISPDGSFELILSRERRTGNWLPMERDTSMLLVRQNLLDREKEVLAELEIERIGGGPPAPLTPAELDTGLQSAAAYVAGTAALFADWAEGFAAWPNQLRPLDVAVKQGSHGDPNIYFYMGYWQLASDEALLIEAQPPSCDYWNFQLNNHWMESLDYRYHQVHYNKHTTCYEADGSFRLVIAQRDPGLPNWVETAGHVRGTMGLRWVKAAHHPQPRTRVVPVAELRGYSAGTPKRST